MKSNLVARVHNVNLTNGAFVHLAFDWPGQIGKAVVEGLALTGTALIQANTFVDTMGQTITPIGFPVIALDGVYEFWFPPGRLSLQLDATGTGTLGCQVFSVYTL